MYSWHDEGFEEEEQWESGIEKTDYDAPRVSVETFKVKRFSQQGDGIRGHLGSKLYGEIVFDYSNYVVVIIITT
nr:hypothetical protein [Tanacetum cinerariifolium]